MTYFMLSCFAMEDKRFSEWIKLKQGIHESKRRRLFKEGEIWWCFIGENVGTEINGKSDLFLRPVLVFRKFGADGFLGIPLSSRMHEGIWYVSFIYRNKYQCALLSQARVLSVYRLYDRFGRISRDDYCRILEGMSHLYIKNIPPRNN